MSTISVIGSGGLATKAGHSVEIISRDPAKAQALAGRLSTTAITGAYGAKPAGEIVILAVPYASAAAVVSEYGDALGGKVIIDISNPLAPGLTSLVTTAGSSGAQEIAKGVPAGAHVVKSFNTIFGHVLARGERLDAFIADDDAEVKARVSTFIASLGLRPLDVGGLSMAHSLEALGMLLIGLARNGAGTFDIAINVNIG
ncbi:NAD(P)-binding domain-containing protein [Candidatus Sodalis endolongispinus]|uniref:NAD(P)-binding domain-containing protein n=1 Tax=Candidatus Sodalis endolongispinus TaxID=2812662 RepID=A0ABS5YEN6_9GAMM|nr:NAD(P)-binding domain-containing protein [Candidatus Sodalis endolongispinus]MBT9433407.1 NAD(P)-binding domain-containing protein [Candidatus Sodalis endolongispinus]